MGNVRDCCGLLGSRGRKARLGDALIAQGCVDRGIPLLTRDKDFRNFADTAELNLVRQRDW